MARDPDWRKKELSYKEVVKKYPHLPPLWILKIDAQRRGVIFTDEAKKRTDPNKHQLLSSTNNIFRINNDSVPEGLILKDGSFLVISYDYDYSRLQRDPYVVDVIDDKIVITDEGEALAEVEYWEKPDFFNKNASNGQPYTNYISARPQRIDIALSMYCHFWDKPGNGCKYCNITPNFLKTKLQEEQRDIKYIAEAVREAVKQEGRFSGFMISGGSILSGKNLLDDELDSYIKLIQEIDKIFDGKYPIQLISSAFNEEQLWRLKKETNLLVYTTDIEVLNERIFSWVCKGKHENIGYQEWKRRLIAAVDIFGKGNVTSGMVAGVELAKPEGFKSEDEAFESTTAEAETIIKHGISLAANVWRASPGSIFQNETSPSLDYFVRLLSRFDELHHKYEVGKYSDDYRRCGMHPGLDLLRI